MLKENNYLLNANLESVSNNSTYQKHKQKRHSQDNKIRSILKESLKQVLQEEGTRQ